MRKLFMHPCIFHQVTGFYCPGCGGTRAVLALVKGNMIQSFLYHPIVVYTAGLLIWYGISHVLEWITKGKLKIGMRFRNGYVYAGLFIVLINWLIRNFLLFQYGITLGDL